MRSLATVAAGIVVLPLCGCGFQLDPAPSAKIPPVCEDQVYADPKVKDLIMRGAGNDTLRRNTEDQLRYAKLDAAHRCMQQKGLLPPGGGVERPRSDS